MANVIRSEPALPSWFDPSLVDQAIPDDGVGAIAHLVEEYDYTQFVLVELADGSVFLCTCSMCGG